ncbi:MAG: translocation/assembly module TamB domain-containing protein, partial [Treponema sp.]|nr:translocation/assembly module TamB domain-containing protein [Treponema sp.]
EGLLPLGRADFSLAGRGDPDYIQVDTLGVVLPQGKFRFQGGVGLKPLAPQGHLSVSDLSLSGNEQVTANFIIATQDNVQGREFRLFGETATFGTIALSNLDGSIMVEDKGLTFLVSALRFGEPAPDSDGAPPAQMALDGSFDYQSRYVEARIVLDTFPVRDIVDLARPFVPLAETVPAPLDQVYLSTETFINTDFTHISYNALDVVIAYRGNEDIAARLSLSGTDQRFEIRNSRILWNNGELGIAGYANLMNPLDITFALETSYMDMSYYLEGTILDSRLISIQGSNGFKVEVTMTDQRGYAGYIEVEDLLIPVGPLWSALKLSAPYEGRFIRFSLMAFLHFDSPESWYVNLDPLEIGDIQTPVSPMTSLRLKGSVNQNGATFSPLVFNDSIGMLSGDCSLSWNRAFSDITGTLLLRDEPERRDEPELKDKHEQYKLTGRYQNAHLHLDFNGSAMQLARIIPDSYDTVISGAIQVEWDALDSFAATLNLSALSARIQDTELHGTLSAAIDPQAVVLKDLQMTYGGIAVVMPFFHLNRLEHRIETEVQIQGTLGGRDLETAFSLAVDFKPIDSWMHLPELINTFSGTLAIAHARFDTLESKAPFSFMFSRDGSLISVSGGPQDMIRLRISDTGDFFAGLSAPSPIRGTIIGAIDAKTIDIQVPDLYVDLVSLWRFLPPQNVINFTSGFVTAALRIAGPLGDPEFFGVAQSNSVRIQIPQFLTQDVRPIPFDIVLEGNEMTFDAIPAGVGSGRGTIKGWFLFERWIPDTFTLDILVSQGFSIPFGLDLLGIIAQGKVSGNLNLSMADRILSVTGNLIPDDTEITLNAEELAVGRNGEVAPQAYFQVMTDITLRTGPKVEFIWPSANFPIVQAVADMGTSLHIMSDSVTNRYSLVGDINLRSGEIFYFQRSFYIRQGILSFNENEIQFDPRISARAEVRDRTNDGPVTISLIIDNSPLQSFSARFESSPALSQMEIISLFGQNLTGTTQEAGKDSDQIPFLASGLDFLAQTQVVRRFERIIRDFLKLDMFSARTQLLQNIATQTFQVQNPVDRSNSVGNYFDNTAVFVGKYIGSDMFFQWMTSFRYDENEHTLGGLSWRGLAVEPDIGIELRGPLFDIRWNITPLHFVESMCIEDVSFSVTWRRSGIFLKDCFTKQTK